MRKKYPSFYPAHKLDRRTLAQLEIDRVNYFSRVTLRAISIAREYVLCEDEQRTAVKLHLAFQPPALRSGCFLLVREPFISLKENIYRIELKFQKDLELVPGWKAGELALPKDTEGIAAVTNKLVEEGYPEEALQLLDPYLGKAYIHASLLQPIVKALMLTSRLEEAYELAVKHKQDRLQELVLQYSLQANGVVHLPSLAQKTFISFFLNPKVKFNKLIEGYHSEYQFEENEIVMVDESLGSYDEGGSPLEAVFAKLQGKPGYSEALLRYYNIIYNQKKERLNQIDIEYLAKENKIHVEDLSAFFAESPKDVKAQLFIQPVIFNHCCEPNCEYLSYGKVFVLKTRKQISKAEMLTVSYVSRKLPVEKRRKELSSFGFKNCKCRDCYAETPCETKQEGSPLAVNQFKRFRKILDDCPYRRGLQDLRRLLSKMVMMPLQFEKKGRQLILRKFKGWGLDEPRLKELVERQLMLQFGSFQIARSEGTDHKRGRNSEGTELRRGRNNSEGTDPKTTDALVQKLE